LTDGNNVALCDSVNKGISVYLSKNYLTGLSICLAEIIAIDRKLKIGFVESYNNIEELLNIAAVSVFPHVICSIQ
jgi:hypothetical protein